MFDILLKFSMINNFGASFTLRGLDDESFLELQYMQVCISALHKAQEMQNTKQTFYSREGLMR